MSKTNTLKKKKNKVIFYKVIKAYLCNVSLIETFCTLTSTLSCFFYIKSKKYVTEIIHIVKNLNYIVHAS